MSMDIGFAAQTPSLPGAGRPPGGWARPSPPTCPPGPARSRSRSTCRTVRTTSARGSCCATPRRRRTGPSGWAGRSRCRGCSARRPAGRPRYDDDRHARARGLRPAAAHPGRRLRPEVDTGDWRIEPPRLQRRGFVATDRAGNRFQLGTTADSRIAGPAGIPWAWLLHASRTTSAPRPRSRGSRRRAALPRHVAYGVYEVRFAYEPRPDAALDARRVRARHRRRCAASSCRSPDAARRWSGAGISGTRTEPSGASLLTSVTMTGVAADGTSWRHRPDDGYTARGRAAPGARPAADARPAPPALDRRGRVELVDWDGDGLPDLVEVGPGGAARVWRTRRHVGPSAVVANLPQLAGDTARAALVDLDGNGLADLVRVDVPAPGTSPAAATGWRGPSVGPRALGGARRAARAGSPISTVTACRPALERRAARSCSRTRTTPAAGRRGRGRPACPDGPPTDLDRPARVPRRHDR